MLVLVLKWNQMKRKICNEVFTTANLIPMSVIFVSCADFWHISFYFPQWFRFYLHSRVVKLVKYVGKKKKRFPQHVWKTQN